CDIILTYTKITLQKFQDYQGGLNKEEFLRYLEEVFGRQNFKDKKYQGGSEIIGT
ncbi:5431_t:CDS:1, partial [Funneliformis geosporum]